MTTPGIIGSQQIEYPQPHLLCLCLVEVPAGGCTYRLSQKLARSQDSESACPQRIFKCHPCLTRGSYGHCLLRGEHPNHTARHRTRFQGAGTRGNLVKHLRPITTVVVTTWGIPFHGVDSKVRRFPSNAPRRPHYALCQDITKPFTMSYLAEQRLHRLNITPGHLQPPGVLLGDETLLITLHNQPYYPPCLIHLQAKAVNHVSEHHRRCYLHVANLTPHCRQTLKLGLLHHHTLIGTFSNRRFVAMMHRASPARVRLGLKTTTNILRGKLMQPGFVRINVGGVILDGQGTNFLYYLIGSQRSIIVTSSSPGVCLYSFHNLPGKCGNPL